MFPLPCIYLSCLVFPLALSYLRLVFVLVFDLDFMFVSVFTFLTIQDILKGDGGYRARISCTGQGQGQGQGCLLGCLVFVLSSVVSCCVSSLSCATLSCVVLCCVVLCLRLTFAPSRFFL